MSFISPNFSYVGNPATLPPLYNSQYESGVGVGHVFQDRQVAKVQQGSICAIEDCKKLSKEMRTNPDGSLGKICKACYNRFNRAKKAKEEDEKGTTCSIKACKRKNSKTWYSDGSIGKICSTCYSRFYRAKKANEEAEKGTACSVETCKRTKSTRWYPDGSLGKVCTTCYDRIRAPRQLAEEAEKGTTCSIEDCKTLNVTKWLKNPMGGSGKVCRVCYDCLRYDCLRIKSEKASKVNRESQAPLKRRKMAPLAAPVEQPFVVGGLPDIGERMVPLAAPALPAEQPFIDERLFGSNLFLEGEFFGSRRDQIEATPPPPAVDFDLDSFFA